MNRLNQFGGKVGLKINIDKTKVLRYNPGRLDPLMIRERDVEDVESFVYLKLNVFQNKCLRKILKVYWPMKISNEEIRERSSIRKIDEQVRTRRWKWLGHVLRMPSDKDLRSH